MKGTSFQWLDKFEQSFQELNYQLVLALIFTLSSPRQDFIIYSDACKIRLGCVIMQNAQLVAYTYRKLNHLEKNYHPYDLELTVVTFYFEGLDIIFVKNPAWCLLIIRA